MQSVLSSLWRGVVFALACATSAPAMPQSPSQRAELFAICAGRMAALATYSAANQVADADDLRQQANDFDLMLDSSLPAALANGVPHKLPRQWRAQGWSEIAHHLADITYHEDMGRVERATHWMAQKVQSCQRVLLY